MQSISLLPLTPLVLCAACFASACASRDDLPADGPSAGSAAPRAGSSAEPTAGSRAIAGAGSLPEPSDPLPAEPPAAPEYSVPVSAELAPFATFDVTEVKWLVKGTKASLEYDFPAGLSGVAAQQVSFEGEVIADGAAELSGLAGTARCEYSVNVARCAEELPDLAVDAAAAKAALDGGLPMAQRQGREDVIETFAADPIGVLIFDPRTAVRADDRGEDDD